MASASSVEPVIVSYKRTPFGRAFKGSFAEIRPEDLAVQAIRSALSIIPADMSNLIDDSYYGCAVPQGAQGDNIGRRINVMLGLQQVPAVTVNRFCSSSLQTTAMAAQAIRAGEGSVYLVAGVESTSSTPPEITFPHPLFSEPAQRAEQVFESDSPWIDPTTEGLLPDIYISMGKTAEFVARSTGTTRAEQDAWALQSQQRTEVAAAAGYFTNEIVGVTTAGGTLISRDDSPRSGTTAAGLAALQPAFKEGGTVTAGNASPLNDGASALVMMSGQKAAELGLTPLARVLGSSASALSPEIMGLGPVIATEKILARFKLKISDIDTIELNEAFAAQVVPVVKHLKANPELVNPLGGAIAIGHPFGATGARLVGSAINSLKILDGTLGLATLCVGGGQGMALLLERMS